MPAALPCDWNLLATPWNRIETRHEGTGRVLLERAEHRQQILRFLVIAAQIEHQSEPGPIAHQAAVALVRFDHEQVSRAGIRVAEQPACLQAGKLRARKHGRGETGELEDLEQHRGHGGFAAGAGDRESSVLFHQARQELGAMQDRNSSPARLRDVRHRLLDRGRDD